MATHSRQFILPDLGEGLTEAEIVNWLVAEGDVIVVDQPIIEVESAKSIVDLPTPFAGKVEKLHFAVGDTIHTGQAIITVAVEGESPAEITPAHGADSVPGTALRGDPGTSSAEEVSILEGFGPSSRGVTPKRSGRFGNRGVVAQSAPVPSAESSGLSGTSGQRSTLGASPVVSPLVRKLARDNGFVAHELVGSGPNGLVMRADVERAIQTGATGAGAVGNGAAISASTAASAAPINRLEGDQIIPISGLRKVVAERMAASRRDVPEATIWLDVDATKLLEAKDQLEKASGERWSSTALVAKFVVEGLKRQPILNSSVDLAAGQIIQHSKINLGIAAQTARGLMVPVIHDAGSMTTRELREAFVQIVETSKTGSFSPEQLRGGTFTLNNYGGYGTDGSAPIINQPEVGMLGLGRVIDRPWVVDGQVVIRKVMVVSMVFDHRVCDGDVPSDFLGFVTSCIENPVGLLGAL